MTATATRHSFEAIGTRWDIQILQPIRQAQWTELRSQIMRRIESFDKTYSRFRQDSLVTAASKRAGRYELPPDGYSLLRFYEQLHKATKGKVTPLIGQTMADAGYDAQYSFKQKTLHPAPSWESVLSYDKQSFSVARPALLDFGAAGKGYLVDIIGSMMEAAGVLSYAINAGGDIRHRSTGNEALEIGLENPADTSEAIGVASLHNASLCASAGAKRQWGKFHHIIDPQQLQSPREVMACWVAAKDTMAADGLATALFFAPPSDLRKHFSFSYAILHNDMSLRSSRDFPAQFFAATGQL